MKKIRLVISPVTLLALIFLCGCSPLYSEKTPGIPVDLAQPPGDQTSVDPRPFIAWAPDGDGWLLVTWGSSTCPTAPRTLSETDVNQFTIELAREGGAFCTADIAPTTFRMQPSKDIQPDDIVTVDIGPGVIQSLEPRASTN